MRSHRCRREPERWRMSDTKSSAFREMTVPVSSRPTEKGRKGKGIPVFVVQERRQSGQLRAERLVGHSEACHFPNSDMLEGG